MNESKSILLHAIRWIAALVVLLGHAQMYAKQKTGSAAFGWEYIGDHAHAAVMIFFVLSGYVIAWSVDKAHKISWKKYYVDRFSRIYSVLPIAIIITVFLDSAGAQFSGAYTDPTLIPQDNYWVRFFVNLFSLQGVQGFRAQFGSNAALWSIGYEFFYYIVFGLIFFWREIFHSNLKLASIVVLSLFAIAGIKITMYFIIWSLGYIAYKIQKKISLSVRFFWFFLIVVLLVNHFVIYKVLGSNEYVRDFSLGLAVAALFVPVVPVFKGLKFHKFLADFSYSLYAIHMPVLFFAYFVIFDTSNSIKIFTLIAVLTSLVLAWFFSIMAEKKRFILRNWLIKHVKTKNN